MIAAWKADKIQYFELEAEQTPSDEAEDKDEEFHLNSYDTKPTRIEPQGDHYIEWVYIVDLDNDCFIICDGTGCRREFKLQNLPYFLFEEDRGEQETFIMPIALKHLYNTTLALGYDTTDFARFTAFSPRRVTVQVPEESHFKAGARLDPWKPLSQLFLEQFLERYITFFKALATPENLAIFASTGLDGKTAAAYQFKQLAYGILNLCDAAGRIMFRKRRYLKKFRDTARPPRWECSNRNTLWIGDILVILEPRIAVEEFLHAAIGKAIDLVRRSRVRTDGIHGRAVIFSIPALVVVDIKYSDDNTNGPVITYSQTLGVITPSECAWYRCFGGIRANPPAGLAVLIDIFARESESYLLPARLPIEISTQIYNLCDLRTRKSMGESCRAFRALVKAYPRIDNLDLLHTWNHGNVGFVARSGPTLTKCVVSLENCSSGNTGFEMGLFRGGHRIDLDLPYLRVVKQRQEGYKGCACCVGLPILSEAPEMMRMTINITPEMEAERIATSGRV